MPATPPQVEFQHGLLSIAAQNSTLGDILRAVRNQTGAAVDVPPNANERVAGNFGPGPARDVLSSLLNGSHFNYVLLGSASNPDALERVILTMKSNGGEPASAAPDTASAAPATTAAEHAEVTTEDQAPEQGEETNMFAEDPATQGEEPAQTPFGQPAANTRTPEQMLQDLQTQQQQLQQRQQQMGINPALQGPRAFPPGLPQPPQLPQQQPQ